MIAPPGYPKSTSTPASTRVRHRTCAPLRISLIGSHSPEVGGVQRLVLELIRVARLVEGVHERAGTRLDDVRRGTVPGQRFPVDVHLHQYLTEAVAARRDRLHREVQDFDPASDELADGGERGGDGTVAAARSAPLPGPRTGEGDGGGGGHGAARHLQKPQPVSLGRVVK